MELLGFSLVWLLLPVVFLILFALSMAAASVILNLVYYNYEADEPPVKKEKWRILIASFLVMIWSFVLLKMLFAFL